MGKLLYEEETYKIRGVCFDIYKKLGAIHKEKVYQKALLQKLTESSLKVEKEKRITVKLDGKDVGTYQPDFVVDDKIIIELKAKPQLVK